MALKANDVLIKSVDIDAKEWQTKTWSGLTNFSGTQIWTNGVNIYYSNGDDQYQLDKSTSTWQTTTWSGLNPYGSYIWTDGENIYYSKDGDQFQLDSLNSTWSAKSWTGLTNFDGRYVWTDKENIYYSNGSQYQLDKSTSTWLSKDWQGIVNLTSFNGMFTWQDTGGTIYFSYQEAQYELIPSIHYCYKGDTCQWVKPYTITLRVTNSPVAGIKVIIYRSSNAKGQEPSAVYDSSGGESSYVINVASTAADGQQIVGYYGDTLYVKAQSYSYGSDNYSINGQSYTVTGDGQLIIFVGHSVTCSSCNTSARKNICNIRCSTNIAKILLCSNTSADSSKCML